MKRHLYVIASFIVLKGLMTAYSGSLVGSYLSGNPEIAFALAGLLGHLTGAGMDYFARPVNSPKPA